MIPGCRLIVAAADQPLSQQLVLDQLRLDSFDLFPLVEVHLAGAVADFERKTGRSLLRSTWEVVQDGWPKGSTLELPKGWLESVVFVKYVTAAGVEHEFSADNYIVDTSSVYGRVVLKAGASWPSEELIAAAGVRVQFTAGRDQAEVPKDIQAALLLRVQSIFDPTTTQADVLAAKRIDQIWSAAVQRYRLP